MGDAVTVTVVGVSVDVVVRVTAVNGGVVVTPEGNAVFCRASIVAPQNPATRVIRSTRNMVYFPLIIHLNDCMNRIATLYIFCPVCKSLSPDMNELFLV